MGVVLALSSFITPYRLPGRIVPVTCLLIVKAVVEAQADTLTDLSAAPAGNAGPWSSRSS